MNHQITLDTDRPTRNSLTYYGAWPMMIVWGLDRFTRFISLATVNFGYLSPWSSQKSKKELDAVVEVLSPRYVRVFLHRSKHFHWRPGQNAYLSFPSISTFPFESHPFTISTIVDDSKSDDNTLVFILRVQRGFTEKLLKEASSDTTYKVFLNGPYGSPPVLIGYQTVILIAGSILLSLQLLFAHHLCVIGGSGVAFALPLFLDILRSIFSFSFLIYFSYLSPTAKPDLARMLVRRFCLFGLSVTLVCLFNGYF
jgi:ferric-chelate reductase